MVHFPLGFGTFLFCVSHIHAAQGETLIRATQFRRDSCDFYYGVDRFHYQAPDTQATMISMYLSYIVFKGSVCSANIKHYASGRKIYACPCDTIIDTLTGLPEYPRVLLQECGMPSQEQNSSKQVMCGIISFNTGIATHQAMETVLTFPLNLVLNFTLYQLNSLVVPNLPGCMYVSKLILKDTDLEQKEGLNIQLCGIIPPHNIFSKTNQVTIIWQTRGLHPELASFILSYQPIIQGYAEAYLPSTEEDYNAAKYRNAAKRLLQEDKTRVVELNINKSACLFHGGKTNVQIWWTMQSIFNLPHFVINDFSCMGTDLKERTRLSIYDRLVSCVLPYAVEIDSYQMETLHCSNKISQRILQSTMGDLTVQLTKKIHDIVQFNGTVTYAAMLCPGIYCEQSLYNISQDEEMQFLLSTANKTAQKRLLVSRDQHESGYIMLSNISLRFDGYTLLPCIYGGIFIFESNPLSLVAKICTSWTSQIWDGAVEHGDGSRRLHFSGSPVLLLVKSYSFQSGGYIRGVASLSPCAGLINLDLRIHGMYDVSGRGYVEKKWGQFFSPGLDIITTLRVFVRHNNGCLLLQNLAADDMGFPQYRYNMHMYLTSEIDTVIVDHTFGLSVQPSIAEVVLRSFYIPRIYIPVICSFGSRDYNFEAVYSSQPFWIRKRPSRATHFLFLQGQCSLFGGIVAVMMSFADPIPPRCQSPLELALWYTLRFDRMVYTLPLVPCGTFSLMRKIPYRRHIATFSMNRPYNSSFCCLLQIRVIADSVFYSSIKNLRLVSNFWLDGVSWIPFWKVPEHNRIHRSRAESGFQYTSTNRNLNLLGRTWKINCLFDECAVIVEVSRLFSTFSYEPLMNMSFNFTFLESMHQWINNTKQSRNITNHSFCSVATEKCYTFFQKTQASWEMGSAFCISKGMVLLNAPSDFEWHAFENLLITRTSILNQDELISVGFLNLYLSEVRIHSTLSHINSSVT